MEVLSKDNIEVVEWTLKSPALSSDTTKFEEFCVLEIFGFFALFLFIKIDKKINLFISSLTAFA